MSAVSSISLTVDSNLCKLGDSLFRRDGCSLSLVLLPRRMQCSVSLNYFGLFCHSLPCFVLCLLFFCCQVAPPPSVLGGKCQHDPTSSQTPVSSQGYV